MKAFWAIKQFGYFLLLAPLAACSSIQEMDYYGYEDSFEIPEPQIIEGSSSEELGPSVDDMLGFTSEKVIVIKADTTPKKQEETLKQTNGRFGSKEKVGLRKGLNAPSSQVVYSSNQREEEKEIRALNLKLKPKKEPIAPQKKIEETQQTAKVEDVKPEVFKKIEVVEIVKKEEQEKREKDFLARIVAPKETEQKLILPLIQEEVQPEEIIVQEPVQEQAEQIILKPVEERIVPLPVEERIVPIPVEEKEDDILLLTPPQEKILLVPPEEQQNDYHFDATLFM